MKNLFFLALIIPFFALAESEFEQREKASRERAIAKYQPLFDDPEKLFDDLLEAEISRLDKNRDTVLELPSWPEFVCDRVYRKHEAILASKMGVQSHTPPNQSEHFAARRWENATGTFLVDGKKWKGTIHEYRDGKVSITADVLAYQVVWVPISKLEPEVRAWLGIGSQQDVAAYNARAEREKAIAARQAEAEAVFAEEQRQLAITQQAELAAKEEAAKQRAMEWRRQQEHEELLRMKEREAQALERAARALQNLRR